MPRPSLHHQHFGLVASRRDRKVYIGLLCDRHEKARFSRARASSPGVRRARRARRVREKPGEEAPRPSPGSR
ncbi:acyl-CoA dehydrogenase [Pseudomonas aeruginosa]|nr:acyl-CoA dehydrogenase [Pseudomonas aeruginosa]RUE85518.1 acyl-CoA dehydrogenase [Pseudomonas aeruginosa]